ncbi:hypothetical protein CerSpe_136470 [Prunus speciosa]
MPSSNFKPENEDEELDEKKIYRTTYMFSATMPPAVERLARKYLRNPVVVSIGTARKTNDLITQNVISYKCEQTFQRRAQLIMQCDVVLVAETSLPTAGTEEVSYFEWDCAYYEYFCSTVIGKLMS